MLAPSRASVVLLGRNWGPCRTAERHKPSMGSQVPGLTCHTMELVNPECHCSSHKLRLDKDKGLEPDSECPSLSS